MHRLLLVPVTIVVASIGVVVIAYLGSVADVGLWSRAFLFGVRLCTAAAFALSIYVLHARRAPRRLLDLTLILCLPLLVAGMVMPSANLSETTGKFALLVSAPATGGLLLARLAAPRGTNDDDEPDEDE